MNLKNIKYIIVGSGFFGATIAERIANDLNEQVVVLEKRDHIGGNCHSVIDDATGIECHQYGTHIFHTKNEEVWAYINQFSPFNTYQHKVLTVHEDRVYQMPINLNTINSYYHLNLSPSAAEAFIRKEIEKEAISAPKNLEEKAISLIGRKLYEAFVKGYTEKQWETAPTNLPAHIIERLPVRYDYNANYFDDPYQGMPINGYQHIFREMLDHENITVMTNTDYFDVADQIEDTSLVIYTGPVDRFFNYKHGSLAWRTLRFEKEIIDLPDYQGTSVMNYADASQPLIRIHEFKHLHPERDYLPDQTVIFKEYSKAVANGEEPYYPVNTAADQKTLALYEREAEQYNNIIFGGRLGEYKYYDMDKTIENALSLYENVIIPIYG